MAAPRIVIPSVATRLPTCTPNLMPFHIDYTGPANVSRFMKIEKLKPEELVEEHKAPMKAEEFPLGVNGVEMTGDAPMDTDGPENEGPTPLKRTATDVEMHDSTVTTTATGPAPNADTDLEMHSSTAPTTTLSASRTESTIIESQTTTSTLASSSSLSPYPTTATPTALLEDADKRFISTFRGRTIHGLTIDLPPGYGGLVLRCEGNDTVNPGTGGASAEAAYTNSKGRAKPDGKTGSAGTSGKGKGKEEQQSKKAPPRRGRLTRSATLSKPEVIAVEEEPVQEAEDDKMANITPTRGDDNGDDDGDGEVPNKHPVRRLVPHAQFSSFTLWHQDRPVDKGRDEYCRTLTEWFALSHEVNKPLVSLWAISVADTFIYSFFLCRFTGPTYNYNCFCYVYKLHAL